MPRGCFFLLQSFFFCRESFSFAMTVVGHCNLGLKSGKILYTYISSKPPLISGVGKNDQRALKLCRTTQISTECSHEIIYNFICMYSLINKHKIEIEALQITTTGYSGFDIFLKCGIDHVDLHAGNG